MNPKKIVRNTILKLLKEQNEYNRADKADNVDFNDFPKELLDLLNDEYFHYYQNKFDWNAKQDEFFVNGEYDGKGFRNWIEQNEKEEFLKNLNTIIKKIREDLILINARTIAEKTLEAFEELIKPALGNEVLTKPLSMFIHRVIMNPDVTPQEIEAAFKETKNIIDADGSINQDKIEMSHIFTGGEINIPAFERFAKENPTYRGVYKDWKKLYDKFYDLEYNKELNAFRNFIDYDKLKRLYRFLVEYKTKL